MKAAPSRVEFEGLVEQHCAPGITLAGERLLDAYNTLANERDALTERVRIAEAQAERLKPGSLVLFSMRCEVCGGRDPRKALPHDQGHTDSRIEAWRRLDAEERAYSTRRLAIAGRLGEVAAAALESLGGKP